MSLSKLVGEKYNIGRYDVDKITMMSDLDLELYIEDLLVNIKRGKDNYIYNRPTDKVLYDFAISEAARRLSMHGARSRFKQER